MNFKPFLSYGIYGSETDIERYQYFVSRGLWTATTTGFRARVLVGGALKTIRAIKILIGGVLKTVKQVKVLVGGSLKNL